MLKMSRVVHVPTTHEDGNAEKATFSEPHCQMQSVVPSVTACSSSLFRLQASSRLPNEQVLLACRQGYRWSWQALGILRLLCNVSTILPEHFDLVLTDAKWSKAVENVLPVSSRHLVHLVHDTQVLVRFHGALLPPKLTLHMNATVGKFV
jgi:hypothetical protein